MRQLDKRHDPLSKEHPRVVVCGTRTFPDRALLYKKLDELTRNLNKPVVVTGAGKPVEKKVGKKRLLVGADFFAEMWAADRKLALVRFHARWDKYQSRAGPMRNSEMLQETIALRKPAFLIAFMEFGGPLDKVLQDAIAKARRLGFVVKVIKY